MKNKSDAACARQKTIDDLVNLMDQACCDALDHIHEYDDAPSVPAPVVIRVRRDPGVWKGGCI